MSTETLTRREIAHFVTLFFYNWGKKDFIEIYKNSRVGELYFWDKLQGRLKEEGSNSTNEMVNMFLNMDNECQQLLIDYVLDKKYKSTIQESRKWAEIIKNATSEE